MLNAGANRSSDTAFPIRIGNDLAPVFFNAELDGFDKVDFMFSAPALPRAGSGSQLSVAENYQDRPATCLARRIDHTPAAKWFPLRNSNQLFRLPETNRRFTAAQPNKSPNVGTAGYDRTN